MAASLGIRAWFDRLGVGGCMRNAKDYMDAPENAEEFLKDADLFVDGIDAFEIDVRRLLFRLAAQHGRYAITAGHFALSETGIGQALLDHG